MTDIRTQPMKDYPLSDQQKLCKQFLLDHPFAGLFVPMGVGKTRITLEALWGQNPNHHVLVIAPKTIARSVWQDEMEKWGMTFRTKSLIVNDKGKDLTKAKRHKLYDEALDEPPTIYFINRELVVDLVNHGSVKDGQQYWAFPTIIIDEFQSFKSYNAQRFKALRKIRSGVTQLIGLTGTPTPNGLMDLWSQVYLLDGGERLGRNITAYRNQFFTPGLHMNGYPVQWIPNPNAKQQILNNIRDVVMSIDKVDFGVPLVLNNMTAHMDEKETKMYRTLLKERVLVLDGKHIVEAVNAGVLTAKLSQMASGALYKETGSTQFKLIHTHKLELTDYIIQNTTPEPVLIAYYFQSDREMLLAYLKGQGIDARVFDKTPEMIYAWNNKQIPVMLIQPASAGFGLNLQMGGSTLIWYTIPWSLELYEQTIARLHRNGQKNPVKVYHLLTKGTIDERILPIMQKKGASQQDVLNAVMRFVKTT